MLCCGRSGELKMLGSDCVKNETFIYSEGFEDYTDDDDDEVEKEEDIVVESAEIMYADIDVDDMAKVDGSYANKEEPAAVSEKGSMYATA